MSSYSPKLLIERRLEELKDVPERDPLQAASSRARFLREAAEFRQAVSRGRSVRQSGWIFRIRKEKLAMYALVSLVLAASLLLGGGATVAFAQNDLPDQPLYALKLWTENARLAMCADPQDQAELLMSLEQTRVEEITALAEKGITPPDQVRDRLEAHLRQTSRLAADMDDAGLERTLLQLRDRLQKQDRLMQQLQIHASPETGPLLTRTREMLQLHLRLAEQGLADPQGFRYMMRNRLQYGPAEEATPGPYQQGGPGFHGPTTQPTGTPSAVNGNGNCEGNGIPCGPNPNEPQPGNGGNHPESPHDGNGPNGGHNGSDSGCGGCGGGDGGSQDGGGSSRDGGGNGDGGGSGGGGGHK